ncbi:MAG: hypothetical protein DRH90_19750 [Deltaproteobacteria bacterium]|nr:MAG: hypothetical protein DRH90_19750 [Deltaproteobacteria bacterium]RLC10480.1 MAG: hypothetical protein DRI24_20250 [Deltaproteobacteria bacterium]
MTPYQQFVTIALASGMMPVPFRLDHKGNKTTASKWNDLATWSVSTDEIHRRFKYATMCGFCLTSKHTPYTIVIDLDCHGGRQTDTIEGILKRTRIICGAYGIRPWVARTPSGGFHIYLFSNTPHKKKVIASYANGDDKIDWRSGKCLVVAPTPGETIGYQWDTEPTISNGQYQIKPFPDQLINEIRQYYLSCNQHIPSFTLPPKKASAAIVTDRDKLPGVIAGSDYSFVSGFLTYHGWTEIGISGDHIMLSGDHKSENEKSASYSISQTMFTNFSTSCPIFGNETKRNKDTNGKEGLAMQFIYLFAQLETHGDLKLAAKILSEKFK